MAKILAVDDNTEVLQQLNVLLRGAGHEFSFIAQPSFLFPRLENEKFDLILLDLNMPDTNGMQLLKEIKSDNSFKETPVIMITAEGEDTCLQKCFKLGAADYIKKPINETILHARVNAVLAIQEKIKEIVLNQEFIRQQQLEIHNQKTLQYQLRSLSTSMNPHFIFNALNSIQYYILDNKIDLAMSFIADFSSLMRVSLNNSTREYISLEDEVEFLDYYLKVEQRRMSGKLKYNIIIPDDLNGKEFKLPPMLIQPYIENSIVHGIINRNGNGNIKIEFSLNPESQTICCQITDDGIGRKASLAMHKNNGRKSYGMKITKTRLELLNSLEKNSFKVNVQDLVSSSGDALGTQVSIELPSDL